MGSDVKSPGPYQVSWKMISSVVYQTMTILTVNITTCSVILLFCTNSNCFELTHRVV